MMQHRYPVQTPLDHLTAHVGQLGDDVRLIYEHLHFLEEDRLRHEEKTAAKTGQFTWEGIVAFLLGLVWRCVAAARALAFKAFSKAGFIFLLVAALILARLMPLFMTIGADFFSVIRDIWFGLLLVAYYFLYGALIIINGILDAIRWLGVHVGPVNNPVPHYTSPDQVYIPFITPFIAGIQLCPQYAGIVDEVGYLVQATLSPTLCPVLRYIYPSPLLRWLVVSWMSMLTFNPDPTVGDCTPPPDRTLCEVYNAVYLVIFIIIIVAVCWGWPRVKPVVMYLVHGVVHVIDHLLSLLALHLDRLRHPELHLVFADTGGAVRHPIAVHHLPPASPLQRRMQQIPSSRSAHLPPRRPHWLAFLGL